MKTLSKILRLMFRDIPLRHSLNPEVLQKGIGKDFFVHYAFAYDQEHGENEFENLWNYYRNLHQQQRKIKGFVGKTDDTLDIDPFSFLFDFVDEVLCYKNNEVECKFDHFIEWRQTSVNISEDLLVSAFLAMRFSEDDMKRIGFDWPIAIGQDNDRLNDILSHGMSENHFHLYGSAPVFHFSWLSLMNRVGKDPIAERRLNEYERNRLRFAVDLGEESHDYSLATMRLQAAYIRMFLFCYLTEQEFEVGNFVFSCRDVVGGDRKNACEYSRKCKYYQNCKDLDILLNEKRHLEYFKDLISKNVYHELSINRSLVNIYYIIQNSYSMEENLSSLIDNINEQMYFYYDSLKLGVDYITEWCRHKFGGGEYEMYTGERWLLFTCLHRILHDDLPGPIKRLFYAYCIIREKIRGELIQSNEKVGFDNFQKYSRRKLELIEDPLMAQDMVRNAIQQVWRSGQIHALEVRFTPYRTWMDNAKMIEDMDSLLGYDKHPQLFYVTHFIKTSDNYEDDMAEYMPRNYQTREVINKQARAIVALREKDPIHARRILGIDAASREIDCRPEVFGPVYRMLKKHIATYDIGLGTQTLPQLKATYHVGEDFVDPVDGLRAVDEAINFLDLTSGDRIGHATVLGIDVHEWYRKKGNEISIKRQNLLDNYVWLYNQFDRFGIGGFENLKTFLHDKASVYFQGIFGRQLHHDEVNCILEEADEYEKRYGRDPKYRDRILDFDIAKYYRSWQVRGDDPSLYERGYFRYKESSMSISEYEYNKDYPHQRRNIRKMPEVFLLYHYYHFNRNVKRVGNKSLQIEIQPEYVKAVELVQRRMINLINTIGIGIEVNPSSNYEISTFKDYAQHPILRLYNEGLAKSHEVSRSFVSINTDDMGVFATSLPNEYALMAASLASIKDENGQPVYGMIEILEWINEVRKYGNAQSFYRPDEKESLMDEFISLAKMFANKMNGHSLWMDEMIETLEYFENSSKTKKK